MSPERLKSSGHTEVISGSMFAGKTEELMRRVRRAQYADKKVQLFKPEMDNRYSDEEIVSHDGNGISAIPVNSSRAILENLEPDTQVVAVDEAQFFDEELPDVCDELANRGIRVIAAGLDLDFRGEPFGPMTLLILRADEHDKLHAICDFPGCDEPACRTQRKVNGEPANFNEPVILVGADEAYGARCRGHHQVPGKPGK